MWVIRCDIVVTDQPTILFFLLVERYCSVNAAESKSDRALSYCDIEFAFEQLIIGNALVIEPIEELKHLLRNVLSP